MSADERGGVAVVVTDSRALDATVARAVERPGSGGQVTVLCPNDAAADRADAWLRARDRAATVRTLDEFDVGGVTAAVEATGVGRAVVSPDLPFPVSALRARLPNVEVEVRTSHSGRARARTQLRQPTDWAQRVAVFGLAFGFYVLLGRVTPFDVVTGATSAAVVVLLLSHVTFTEPPTLRRSLPRVARAVAFVPYLLWEILRANLALALVLLDPRLPVEPSVEELDAAADSDLERAVLANSITLTPGTLTVDIHGSSLVVHTLTPASRAGLREGDLQRAVRFVFRGRRTDAGRDEDGERTVGRDA